VENFRKVSAGLQLPDNKYYCLFEFNSVGSWLVGENRHIKGVAYVVKVFFVASS
jgi:hypothetical protein